MYFTSKSFGKRNNNFENCLVRIVLWPCGSLSGWLVVRLASGSLASLAPQQADLPQTTLCVAAVAAVARPQSRSLHPCGAVCVWIESAQARLARFTARHVSSRLLRVLLAAAGRAAPSRPVARQLDTKAISGTNCRLPRNYRWESFARKRKPVASFNCQRRISARILLTLWLSLRVAESSTRGALDNVTC